MPMKGKKYLLEIGDERFEGVTDSNGILSHVVAEGATVGKLTLDMWSVDLEIRPSAVPDTDFDVRMKLDNLGFHATGSEEPISDALMRFQSAFSQELTASLDPATHSTLKKVYGC
jgi:hypothetical protein